MGAVRLVSLLGMIVFDVNGFESTYKLTIFKCLSLYVCEFVKFGNCFGHQIILFEAILFHDNNFSLMYIHCPITNWIKSKATI